MMNEYPRYQPRSSLILQVRKEANKYPPQLELGFRIVGMKVRALGVSAHILEAPQPIALALPG
jgi:hypothetical protein